MSRRLHDRPDTDGDALSDNDWENRPTLRQLLAQGTEAAWCSSSPSRPARRKWTTS